MKDWQVDETSDPDNQWQLLETEQELPTELTLEETEAAPQDWQPVEYAEPEPSGGRNWILPSFIILAMVAVVAYIGWLALTGAGIFPATTASVTETPLAVQDPGQQQHDLLPFCGVESRPRIPKQDVLLRIGSRCDGSRGQVLLESPVPELDVAPARLDDAAVDFLSTHERFGTLDAVLVR